MRTIYKYVLKVTDIQNLTLPSGSRIISVEEQNGEIVLYAVVNTSMKTNTITDKYVIFIIGTGHCADNSIGNTFLGTVKLAAGQLMFHVFYGLV